MMAAFIIWLLISLVPLGVGIMSLKSKQAVHFFTGSKPPEVSDVRKYNRAVAALWFAYALLLALLGLPFLFLKQNAAGFLWCIAGVPVLSLALMIAYTRVLRKYERKKDGGDH